MDTTISTPAGPRTGKVFKKTVGRYWVKSGGDAVICTASSKLRKVLVYPEADASSRRPTVDRVVDVQTVDPVAVGDEVTYKRSDDGTGVITEVLPRRNKLSRKAAGTQPLEQVIIANLDQMVAVVAAAQPPPKWKLLDRYLADAEFLEVPALICITKMDLVDEGEFAEDVNVYREVGYSAVLTSAVTGLGMDELKSALEDRVSVFLGKSGVGKTTLLNRIQPDLGLAVQEVSGKTGKGKHTTSHLEMFELGFGGSVADTPGIREFGLWQTEDIDITWLFREMRPYIGSCKFGASCTHSHEPGCAVKAAVEAGEITKRRYDNLLRLQRN
ncbi:MAG: ribosome small subunit-dependent GTPase A [Candidatus Coatesbacteria bacterium]|nr:MAG: ribosome small subunit-dependent GTPase A [Candidatus Coatesbacteria bacterium]